MNRNKRVTEQQEDARARLREIVEPGATVYTILRHVSRSGMSRDIGAFVVVEGAPWDITGLTARAIGNPLNKQGDGVKMGGCGMDMGFALVYELSYWLFKAGFECTGKDCPANDHNNGDRDYSPHRHSDPGYALRHRWA